MKNQLLVWLTTLLIINLCVETFGVQLETLTIYDIQHPTDTQLADASYIGDSQYDGQMVNCAGGTVIHKFRGGKITLFDPAQSQGWGGLVVKDLSDNWDLFDGVQLGDWVSFENILVNEYNGNTQLEFTDTSGDFHITPGHSLPSPIIVSTSDLSAPADNENIGGVDLTMEKYEAMYLKVEGVTVGTMDLGRKDDNYELNSPDGTCWGADYMSTTKGVNYHPLIQPGQAYESISGILEQSYKNDWNYFQLLTTGDGDIVPGPEPLSCALLLLGTGIIFRRRQI